MRKIGLLGGTFHPVHMGHLRLAEACQKQLQLEEIWFIPAALPPHKDGQIASYEQRRKWLEQTLNGKTGYRILDIEQEREGKSYTYDTLRELCSREPDCEFYFLTGADSLEKLDTWHRWEDILDMCHFVATTRPGFAGVIPDIIAAEAKRRKGEILFLEIDALNISSTEIRERVVLGKNLESLIPSEIIDEVKACMEIRVEGYKEILKKRLSVKRYTHSIGVANTAAKLAGMFHGDIQRAFFAGLLHDYAREMSDSELLELAMANHLSGDAVDLLQPSLLHGPVGAWLLRDAGMVADEQILQAICWHTTGHPEMDQLARIIYIADYIEPNRKFPGVDALREIAHRDLNLGVLAGLDHTITYLIQKNGYLHPWSIAARNRLLEEQLARKNN